MRSLKLLLLFLIAWIIFAQSCMTFRKADSKMKTEFAEKGVALTTDTKTIDGRHIHYAKTGNDTFPTIYFIHGTPGSWDAFAGYLKDSQLLQQFRLISIDRPGFGYSDFGDAVNLQRQSELISPIFYMLDNKKPVYIVGHSLGGPMAVKLVADNPGFFSGMVQLAGSNDPKAEKPEKWRPWLYKTPLNFLVPGAMRPSNEELWYLKKDLVGLQADFAKINCDVYILHGNKDVLVPVSNVEYDKKMLTNARSIKVILFPEENHFIPWTQFTAVKEVLIGLVNSNTQVKSTMSSQ